MKSLGDLLSQFHRDQNHKRSHHKKGLKSEAFDFLELVNRWPEIIGPRLAAHSIPLKNVRKNLTILTRHPALGSQVGFLGPEIIKKIEKEFPSLKGKIAKLTFICDPTYFDQRQKQIKPKENVKAEVNKEEFHPHSPKVRKWTREAQEMTAHIEDENLKEAMKKLYLQFAKDKDS